MKIELKVASHTGIGKLMLCAGSGAKILKNPIFFGAEITKV